MKPTAVEPTFDVFLSHSSKDREFATRLASDLSRTGIRVWIDQDIRVGQSFAEAITKALSNSRFLMLVMSPDYFLSPWTQTEWQYGLGRELEDGSVRLIPLLLRECDLPPLLRGKLWVDFRNPSHYLRALDRLVNDLRAPESQLTSVTQPMEEPKSGQRVTELDATSIAELKTVLRDAVEAFGAKSSQVNSSATPQVFGIENDLCFVVMPFAIESLNIVYQEYVKPTLVDRCKIRVLRGDDVFGSNVIMDDITDSIRRARLIVADLTGRNANVFYEVGIAHALNKQVLLMTQSIDDVPFDLRYRRALVYEYSPFGCKKLERDLYENVRSMLA